MRPFGELRPAAGAGPRPRAADDAAPAASASPPTATCPPSARTCAAVLDALPFLGDSPDEAPADGELAARRPGTRAGRGRANSAALARGGEAVRAIEWPQGQAGARATRRRPRRSRRRSPAAATGSRSTANCKLDESRVLSLQQLLGLLREAARQPLRRARRRRVPARWPTSCASAWPNSTRWPRPTRQGLKLGATAGAWLAETPRPISALQGDNAWRRRAARPGAQPPRCDPALPAGAAGRAAAATSTRATSGWRRLAAAGFGAMPGRRHGPGQDGADAGAAAGARRRRGPALVVAPTSVCGNWAAEAARFAPGAARARLRPWRRRPRRAG
ncbi:MAG: hypothetical protein MZW92_66895 [Comamonadaceae bacterium]|nr:hypothetical protein [Comamonadaceae bacterium]